jgi:hypothetical protein
MKKLSIIISVIIISFCSGGLFERWIYRPYRTDQNKVVVINEQPKEGSIVVLGENGSMRLATKEELSILSCDTIQGKNIETNLNFLIDTNSMYVIECYGYYTLSSVVSNISTSGLSKN